MDNLLVYKVLRQDGDKLYSSDIQAWRTNYSLSFTNYSQFLCGKLFAWKTMQQAQDHVLKIHEYHSAGRKATPTLWIFQGVAIEAITGFVPRLQLTCFDADWDKSTAESPDMRRFIRNFWMDYINIPYGTKAYNDIPVISCLNDVACSAINLIKPVSYFINGRFSEARERMVSQLCQD